MAGAAALPAAPAGPETRAGAYLCVVGDDDQSIYRFRGAEVRNILRFPEIFPGTEIIRLERNYRSFQSILDVAGDVVSHNAGRLGKTLVAERKGGSKPELRLLDDQDAEVAFCVGICRERVKTGGRWSDVAILYRTNAQSLGFEKEFPRLGIPYRIVGASRFYDREEVKDALAYLALICNPRDEVAFKRVVNKPSRGIGETSVDLLLEAAEASGADLLSAAAEAGADLRPKARAGLGEFLRLASSLTASLATPAEGGTAGEGETLAGLVDRLVRDSGLAEYHRSQDEIAGTQKVANLEELVNAASLYPPSAEGLSDFLETIELDRSLSSEEAVAADAVTLITMHNTKGLEFPVVIATGLEQGLFPRDDEEGEELEEQRRLFYVAITRAKDELYLSSCHWRRLHGRLYETYPSRFLSELDATLLRRVGRLAAKSPANMPPPPGRAGTLRDPGRRVPAGLGPGEPASPSITTTTAREWCSKSARRRARGPSSWYASRREGRPNSSLNSRPSSSPPMTDEGRVRDRLRRLPPIRRARLWRLYAEDGRRFLDFWMDDGRSILGAKGTGIGTTAKAALDTGLTRPFPSIRESRLEKDIHERYPDYPAIRFFRDEARATAAAAPLLAADESLPILGLFASYLGGTRRYATRGFTTRGHATTALPRGPGPGRTFIQGTRERRRGRRRHRAAIRPGLRAQSSGRVRSIHGGLFRSLVEEGRPTPRPLFRASRTLSLPSRRRA